MRVIHVLRKPLSEGTVASNVLKHGCGGINIDASRVAHANPDDLEAHRKMVEAIKARGGSMDNSWKNSSDLSGANDVPTGGRWPANLILQHLDGCRCDGIKRVRGSSEGQTGGHSWGLVNDDGWEPKGVPDQRSWMEDGKESVANWICEPGCPVAGLDEQSGDRKSASHYPSDSRVVYGMGIDKQGPLYADKGGASRFFKQVGGKTDE